VNISPLEILEILFLPNNGTYSPTHVTIVLDIRLPRVILAALVGGVLAIAGVTMQALFRNPIASPYILGISSGASFGAALAIILNIGQLLAGYSQMLFAFGFAILTVFIVFRIARTGARTSVETLLLTGLAVGSLFSSLLSFIYYFAGENLTGIIFWMMGGLGMSDWIKVQLAAGFILPSIVILFCLGRPLNVVVAGEETAKILGIDVEYFNKILLVIASLGTAAAVSTCGIIGFIGLVVPFFTRLLFGTDHRILLPASCLFGATFLIWVDTLARVIIAPAELPVGILTGILGVPLFLYLLKRRKGKEPI
jgi:iron complex transport system permease protein